MTNPEIDAKTLDEAYRRHLNEALGKHSDAMSKAPEGMQKAAGFLDIGTVTAGVTTFCKAWGEARGTLRMLSRIPFIGSYIANIFALYRTADEFFVHQACETFGGKPPAE